MKKAITIVILVLFLILLVGCQSSNKEDNEEYKFEEIPIEEFSYEVYEQILFGIEELSFESDEITGIEVIEIEFIESKYLTDLITDEIIDHKEINKDININWKQIRKDILIGTGIYMVSFAIRTATHGPVLALVAFVSDVAIGGVFDFLIEVIPLIFKGEEVTDAVLLESIARGYKYGAIFDLTTAIFAPFFSIMSKKFV